MPAFGVYLVTPSRAARAAASTMCGGVGKPGSPTSRWIASGRRQASSMTSRIAWWGRPVARAEMSVVGVVICFARVWGIGAVRCRRGSPPARRRVLGQGEHGGVAGHLVDPRVVGGPQHAVGAVRVGEPPDHRVEIAVGRL